MQLKKISLNLEGIYISETSASKLLECQQNHHNFLVYTDSHESINQQTKSNAEIIMLSDQTNKFIG